MLSIDGSRVRLQVSPELTPMFQAKHTQAGHGDITAAEDADDMVILGSIPVRPNKVTLWGGYTSSRSHTGGMFFPGESSSLSRQDIEATWCVVGGHFPNPKTAFHGIRPDVTNLAEWARIPAISTTFYPRDRLKLDWHLNVRNLSLDTELQDGAGYLTLVPAASHKPPDLRGLRVTTTSQLEVELHHGWSLPDIAVRGSPTP